MSNKTRRKRKPKVGHADYHLVESQVWATCRNISRRKARDLFLRAVKVHPPHPDGVAGGVLAGGFG